MFPIAEVMASHRTLSCKDLITYQYSLFNWSSLRQTLFLFCSPPLAPGIQQVSLLLNITGKEEGQSVSEAEPRGNPGSAAAADQIPWLASTVL